MIRQNMRVTVIDVYMILYFNQKNTFCTDYKNFCFVQIEWLRGLSHSMVLAQ